MTPLFVDMFFPIFRYYRVNAGVTNLFQQTPGCGHMRGNGFLLLGTQESEAENKKPGRRQRFREDPKLAVLALPPSSRGKPRPCRLRRSGPLLPVAPAPAELTAPRRNQKELARGARASGAGPWRCRF